MQPVVILLIAGSAMFIMIGGLSLLSHYYTLNGIKSRTVGDGQYGTARFATQKEIAETYESIPYEPKRWRKGEHLPTAQGMILGSVEKRENFMHWWILETYIADDRSGRCRKDSAFSIPEH